MLINKFERIINEHEKYDFELGQVRAVKYKINYKQSSAQQRARVVYLD